MSKKVCFRVTFDIPDGATDDYARRFVQDAVTSWAVDLDPSVKLEDMTKEDWEAGDFTFPLNTQSVKVTKVLDPVDKTVGFQVVFDFPVGCTYEDARKYVETAVREWGGSFNDGEEVEYYEEEEFNDPDNVFWGFDRESIRVIRIVTLVEED
jgi:hypothetical protein